MTVLVRHDPGCRHARPRDGGHSDAAKSLSDWYNLHVVARAPAGTVFAVRLSDGTSNGDLYDSRQAAVRHAGHNENWMAFIRIGAPSMTVCEAESVLMMERQASNLRLADRDARQGGLQVIPRLTIEGQEQQLAALAGQVDLPIALGYGKET